MIEKLKRPVKIGGTTFREKINELVDAVNELQKHEEQHLDLLTELNEMRLHQNKEPADQYAENNQSAKITQGFKSLQDHRPNMVMDDPFGPHPNIYEQGRPSDPYATQKKWIGKLCRFWDMVTDKGTYGILTDIKDDRYVCPNGMFMCNRIRYHHCEPVKPDDDIIYKGEKQ